MNLELSDLGTKTHVWFPLPQRTSGEPQEWLSSTDFKIITDKKFNNRSAYFLTSFSELKVSAAFPLISFQNSFSSLRGASRRGNLSSNSMVQSDHPAIKNIAHSLVLGQTSTDDKAKKCFDWVVRYLEYANPIRGLYSSVQALTDRKVDCGGFSTLLTALLRAAKIPSRCVFGGAVKSKFGYHAWVEFFDQQKHSWIPCDPSVANLGKRTKLDAGFGFINDERTVFSVGEDLNLVGDDIEWNVPLLQLPVIVSLDKNGPPQKFIEKLAWNFS